MALRLREASLQRGRRSHLSPVPHPAVSSEIYRQIYIALDLPPESAQIIGITSAIRGEGRTTIALGMAQSLASDLDTSITLVEADFGQEDLARHFGLPSSPGLAQVLDGQATLADATYRISENLSVVTSGTTDTDVGRLLRLLALKNPFRDDNSDGIVVLDLPPIMTHSYSSVAAGIATATVVVVRAAVTPGDVVREAIGRLESPPSGVVLNGARSSLPSWWPFGLRA